MFLQAEMLCFRVEYFTVAAADDFSGGGIAATDFLNKRMCLYRFFNINAFNHGVKCLSYCNVLGDSFESIISVVRRIENLR